MFLFQTAAENLRYCWAASSMQDELARQHGNGKSLEWAFWNLHRSKYAKR